MLECLKEHSCTSSLFLIALWYIIFSVVWFLTYAILVVPMRECLKGRNVHAFPVLIAILNVFSVI